MFSHLVSIYGRHGEHSYFPKLRIPRDFVKYYKQTSPAKFMSQTNAKFFCSLKLNSDRFVDMKAGTNANYLMFADYILKLTLVSDKLYELTHEYDCSISLSRD